MARGGKKEKNRGERGKEGGKRKGEAGG